MRVYAAWSGRAYLKPLQLVSYPWLLASFTSDWDLEPFGYDLDAMLTDSGAYTVWQSGGAVDLDAYIGWCLAYRARAYLPDDAVHISLDVMPGERGRHPTEAERREGMERSLANGDTMREAGLPVMEVYHQYEPRSFLDTLLDRLQPGEILGISPRQGQGHTRRRDFCDAVWAHVTRRYDLEVPRLHGLGVGDRELALRYPWYSIDAGSWIAPGKFGRVMGRDGGTRHDPRTRGRPQYRFHHCANVLRSWREWADVATEVWAERGYSWRP